MPDLSSLLNSDDFLTVLLLLLLLTVVLDVLPAEEDDLKPAPNPPDDAAVKADVEGGGWKGPVVFARARGLPVGRGLLNPPTLGLLNPVALREAVDLEVVAAVVRVDVVLIRVAAAAALLKPLLALLGPG
eukprot:sb/3475198/